MPQAINDSSATSSYEPHVVLYARNAAAAGLLLRARASSLRELPIVPELLRSAGEQPATEPDLAKLRDAELLGQLTRAAQDGAAASGGPARADEVTERNLVTLARVLELDGVAVDVLRLLIAMAQVWELRALLEAIPCRAFRAGVRIVAAALGRLPLEVERALAPGARLVAAGFVRVDRSCDDLDDFLTVDGRLFDLVSDLDLVPERVLDRFVPVAPPPSVTALDFAGLATELDLATRLLGATLDGRVRGVNLLIHGATGAGKTQLARLLARAVGATLHLAGKDDGHGASPDASERLTSLQVGQRALSGSRAILLFDELEDLFIRDSLGRVAGREKRDVGQMSKLWFNQILEETPVPTIWISNDVSAVDPAYLRRFAFALELRAPSRAQRRRLWDRHLAEGSALTPDDRDTLAERFPMSPAQIEMAARMAQLLGQDLGREALEALVSPISTLVTPRRQQGRWSVAAGYDPELANSPTDLAALADRLARFAPATGAGGGPGGGPGLTLCLYGPPGTGKSEYARHLAQRMGRPLLLRRCSDILSMWVGGTESHLADAFREAKEEGALLLFDEADSFLRDRRLARHSWEVTVTNEFLQQLEDYPGVVACTTNLVDDLDPASLRRFVFKVRFDYLRPHQAARLFQVSCHALGHPGAQPPPGLAAIERLTPGDFAAVRRRLAALGGKVAPEQLAAELELELRLRDRHHPRRAGFQVSR